MIVYLFNLKMMNLIKYTKTILLFISQCELIDHSRDDEVSVPLESVVTRCTVRAESLVDDGLGDYYELLIRWGLMEPPFHDRMIEFLEALHARAVGHHDHALHNLFLVLPDIFQPKEEEQFEVLEDVWVYSLHQLHVVRCQLERGLLETHVARGRRQDEREVDVDDVSVSVDQDVVVMPVLNREQVLDQAVSCQALDEVRHCSLPVLSEHLFVNVLQRFLARLLL